jgi:LL-diaminopimelate aminotransferase
MKETQRLGRISPYPFAELERKIAQKKAEGIDVISLGIGDPDMPTPPNIVAAMERAVRDPGTHQYPSNRGRAEFREAVASFYRSRFGVDLDPDTQVMPAIGGKESIFNLNLAFLDEGDVALAADPGYPVYTGGPLLVGAEPVLMPLIPERGFVPDLAAISAELRERARVMFLNYPNNPTGAVTPDGFFDEAAAFARHNDVLMVHDSAYSELTFDGYVAPSFLATPGAMDVGVEVLSLSKTYNMTGWRCGAIVGNADAIAQYWKLKTNVDSGLFEAIQLAGVEALTGPQDSVRSMCEIYQRRRDLVIAALHEIGIEIDPPKGTIYVWAPVPVEHTSASFCEEVLEQAAVVVSPGSSYGPNGEGFFRISLTVPDERLTEAVERMRGSLGEWARDPAL